MKPLLLFSCTIITALVLGSGCSALDARVAYHEKAERASFTVPIKGEKGAPGIVLHFVIGNLGGNLAICGAYVPLGKALPGYAFEDALGSMSINVRGITAVSALDYFPRYSSEAELKASSLGCERTDRPWKPNYASATPSLALKSWVVLGKK
ncbi:hypothetical protein [Aliiruegeria sabulilitoris]|uniref:hypothetical protein n=1 Tax=Aliiruegeria sabulilitoris TaxID=1510458 RepID=UPI000831C3B1|nr:hypothetical protein [Aliiruegeria sabulilitoris]NDR54915.1 hypothetical protein [Pseudoruegeria sp. M32A2M]